MTLDTSSFDRARSESQGASTSKRATRAGMGKVCAVVVGLILVTWVSQEVSAATWYVDGSVIASGDGKDWPTAFRKIQEGIDAASHSDTVIVAQGTYVENIKFNSKNIVLTSTDPLDPAVVAATIIDGNKADSVVTFSGTEDETCLLSGFTIRNGGAIPGGGVYGLGWKDRTCATIENNMITGNSALWGGGLEYCDGTIRNNTITGNWASCDGGGLDHCDGLIENNRITSNSADSGGGLAWCGGTIRNNTISGNLSGASGSGGGLDHCHGTIENNSISGNSAYFGGGLSECGGTVQSNLISANSADAFGGGLRGCNGTIQGNTVTENLAASGGGLYGCEGTILNNTITDNSTESDGGGLDSCGGPIKNNVITGNSAGLEGGGLSVCGGTIENNTVTENSADYDGGGLYGCDGIVANNTIAENSAGLDGGGLAWCDGTVENNGISGNSAGGDGGGLAWCDGTVKNNQITANAAAEDGGGMRHCHGTIQNNTICGNSATDNGGGLAYCNGTIENNTIAANSADSRGGGLCSCSGVTRNNTVVSNSANGGGGGLWGCYGILNCIVWANTSVSGEAQVYGWTEPMYSCIEAWIHGGQGNTVLDPQFIDLEGPDGDPKTWEDNDYRLLRDSPCIDAGKNENWMWGAVDLDGNPRIFYGKNSLTVDMGAYEYGSWPFRILEISQGQGGQALLTWKSRPGDDYIVWWCQDIGSGLWTREAATILSGGELTTWTDSDAASMHKFYRIEIE